MSGMIPDNKLPLWSPMRLKRKLVNDPTKDNVPAPGFSAFKPPQAGNRPKNRKYPSKARTPLGG